MPIARINNHAMYYEIHGTGDPVILMGGWGTFCHGSAHHLPRGLTDKYAVAIIDYRGIEQSDDELDKAPSMTMYADDAIGLLEHLKWGKTHFIGLVGMGACIGQVVAIERPDLVRSMLNMGAWCDCTDPLFLDQMEMFRTVHRDLGWDAFQKFVCMLSFAPDYYNANRHKLLGADGPWRELRGKFEVHNRLLTACLGHDVKKDLGKITAPSLIVHCHQDLVTGPRLTKPIELGIPGAKGLDMHDVAHVVAGKEQKIAFAKVVNDWLASV